MLIIQIMQGLRYKITLLVVNVNQKRVEKKVLTIYQ